MDIPIKKAQEICVDYDKSHVLIYVYDNILNVTQVLTYGKSEKNASEIANFGNQFKEWLKFPEELCKSVPMCRICGNCRYFNPANSLNNSSYNTNKHGMCFSNPIAVERY